MELYKSKLTVEEARQGHNIIKAFLKLGIDPEKYLSLVEVCKKVRRDIGILELLAYELFLFVKNEDKNS